MMCIDGTDSSVAIDVVATEKQIAKLKSQLAIGMPGCGPYQQIDASDLDPISIVDPMLDTHFWHRFGNTLRVDFSECLQPISRFQKSGCLGMSRHGSL